MKLSRKKERFDVSLILTFIVIFVSNDTLLFGTNENRLFFWVHVGILIATFIYISLRSRVLNRREVLFAFGLSVMMIMTLIFNVDTEIIKYAYNIFIIFLCAIFCRCVNCQRFCDSFFTVIYYIALFAIVLFLLWIIAPPVVRIFPSITNETGVKYYFLGLGFLEEISSGTLPRMYGIFREPGVFTCFLVLALIIQLYFMKDLNIKRVAVVSLAAVLTFSTAAYILLLLVFGGYFIRQMFTKKIKHRKVSFLFFFLIVLLSLILIVIGPDRVAGLVFNKLTVENESRDSRYGSIAANFRMFLQSPILGKGWNYVEDRFIYFSNLGSYRGGHNTNTFLKLLALYGVGPFTCMVLTTLSFFRKSSKSIMCGIFTTIIWIIALSNEDMSVNILFYLLPFYAFSRESGRRLSAYENTVN